MKKLSKIVYNHQNMCIVFDDVKTEVVFPKHLNNINLEQLRKITRDIIH